MWGDEAALMSWSLFLNKRGGGGGGLVNKRGGNLLKVNALALRLLECQRRNMLMHEAVKTAKRSYP